MNNEEMLSYIAKGERRAGQPEKEKPERRQNHKSFKNVKSYCREQKDNPFFTSSRDILNKKGIEAIQKTFSSDTVEAY